MNPTLSHVSEENGIARFDPRPAPNAHVEGDVVWAVDDTHLHNYLLPRDCPRVTFYPLPESSPDDVERLMGCAEARAVVAIESSWFDRARAVRLYRYALSADGFECIDSGAGYWVSRTTVEPMGVEAVDDPLGEIVKCGVELRILPSLWPLRERVMASSLQFSIIRMRNANPRAGAP